jgi:hypothetical protein
VTAHDDEGAALFASHAPGPTRAEAAAPLVARLAALERKALVEPAESPSRAALTSEAARLRQRLANPGEYSQASRDDRIRTRRALGSDDA